MDFETDLQAERIRLAEVTSITGFSDLTANHMTQVGANTVINAGGGDVITLLGVDMDDLGAADFIF